MHLCKPYSISKTNQTFETKRPLSTSLDSRMQHKKATIPPHLSSPQGLQLFFLCSWIYIIERDMYRVHPTENKCQARGPAKNACPLMLTVWKKSSMTFQGTDGFSVYDSTGQMVFRVDNYTRRNRCMTRGLVLMDGSGRPLMTMRPQVTN